jgi:hypothetical protein
VITRPGLPVKLEGGAAMAPPFAYPAARFFDFAASPF